jgi:hypothetical protein
MAGETCAKNPTIIATSKPICKLMDEEVKDVVKDFFDAHCTHILRVQNQKLLHYKGRNGPGRV